jgi:hypothetical protein
MIPYACIDAITQEIMFRREFQDHESPPVDLPHKHILWRRIVEIHPYYDVKTQMEEGTTQEITDDGEIIITHLIVPRPQVELGPTPSRSLRDIQSQFFTDEKLPLTMVIMDLYNEVLALKGLPIISQDDFKKVLQDYV